MQDIQRRISHHIHTLFGVDFVPDISPAPKPELGEYCINIFPLTKPLGTAPNILSEAIANALKTENDIFHTVSATGGYVNFFLRDNVWRKIFHSTSPTKKSYNQKTIVVDYIGANVGKPLHIGHICTPSIGQTLCNVYTHLGYRVIGDSHFGDWGGIFGKLIYQWKKTNYILSTNFHDNSISRIDCEWNDWQLKEACLQNQGIIYLVDLYQNFHENESEIKDLGAREEFKKLSGGDIENVELWKKFTAISIAETEKKLKLLNIEATYNIGESFYEGLDLPRPNNENYPNLQYTMKDIVKELIDRGIAKQNEDGSVGVVFPEETKMPSCILQKKDGTGLYLTSDLAAIKYRLTNGWNPSKILYCIDVRQQLHMKQAFWIAKAAWGDEFGANSIEFFHAFNGFIKLKEGAMSTRHGTVIFLEELIREGFERTRAILHEKGRNLADADIQKIAVAAIKYSYLGQDREKDVVFDWDKALSFEGNSGPYIQYAYVRAQKIIGENTHIYDGDIDITLSAYDKALIQKLSELEGKIATVAETYKPHHLALYAYDLAVSFNSFYVHTPKILEEKDETLKNFRLALISKTADFLSLSFNLLGIEMPSEM